MIKEKASIWKQLRDRLSLASITSKNAGNTIAFSKSSSTQPRPIIPIMTSFPKDLSMPLSSVYSALKKKAQMYSSSYPNQFKKYNWKIMTFLTFLTFYNVFHEIEIEIEIILINELNIFLHFNFNYSLHLVNQQLSKKHNNITM